MALTKSVYLLKDGYNMIQHSDGQAITSDVADLITKLFLDVDDVPINVCDLGSGSGILGIYLKLNKPNWIISGVEIQSHLVHLAKQNAKNNNLDVVFREGDIKTIETIFPESAFDIVVSNPPFYPLGMHRISPNKERAISRSEIECSMEDVLSATFYLLKPSARAYIIYPKFRKNEFLKKIKNYFELEYIYELQSSNNEKKKLVLFVIKKGNNV